MINDIIDAVDESVLDTMTSIFNEYTKIFVMETNSSFFQEMNIVQESNIPERKTILEKIIFFIPDILRKLIDFIKKKINKLFNKKPVEINKNIKDIIDSKNDKTKQKKIISAFAAVGLTAAFTTTGCVIYNKNKKKVMTFEEDNTSEVIWIGSEISISYVMEVLNDSVNVSTELMKMCLSSDSTKYEKQYKSITKKLITATNALKKAHISDHETNDKKYTIQQLMKEFKQLSDCVDNISNSISVIKNKQFTSNNSTYENIAQNMNNELTNWFNAFQKFIDLVRCYINDISFTIQFCATKGFNDFYDENFESGYDFSYLSSLVTYCSYKGNKLGFSYGAINNPWQKSQLMAPTQHEFDSLGKISDVIKTCFSTGMMIKPVWGHVENKWFVIAPEIEHKKVPYDGDYVITHENYAFIISSEKEFSKLTQFIRNSTTRILSDLTEYMMTPADSESSEKCIEISRDFLAKLMYSSQRGATGLSKDIQPGNDEIFFNVSGKTDKNVIIDKLKDRLNYVFTVTNIKTKPGIMKITLNNTNTNNEQSADYTNSEKVSDEQKEKDKDFMNLMHELSAVYDNTDDYLNS